MRGRRSSGGYHWIALAFLAVAVLRLLFGSGWFH